MTGMQMIFLWLFIFLNIVLYSLWEIRYSKFNLGSFFLGAWLWIGSFVWLLKAIGY